MAAADQHNEIEFNFIERGEMLFRRGSETVTISHGTAAIYWAAVPHQVVAVKPNTQISWFALPLAWFLAWNLPVEFNRQILGEKILVLEKPGATRFREWAKDFDASPDLRIAVKLEIEAFFRRLAAISALRSSSSGCAEGFSEEHHCRHVERMAVTITERFRDHLSIKDIASSAGLTPEYAMRLFRTHWGVTLWTFLLQQRIAEARRLLLLSDSPLIEVAFACGFQSVGRFYHAFKTQCGSSPGAYRRKHRSAGINFH